MKIAIVGGAGAMARAVVKDLVESRGVDELLLIDINDVEANRFATELRKRPGMGVKISTLKVDVFDLERLVNAVKGSDAAIDTTHQDCGVAVARGIIDAGVNGCALGSSHTIAREILKLDKRAKERGVTFLVNAGVFPGATGIIAKYLANKLDQAEEVHLSMVIFRPIALTPALTDLFISFLPSEGLVYENGMLKKTPPFSGREEVEYPEPFGRQVIYNITSCDPLTIPLAIKGVKNVCVKATYYPDYTEMLRIFYDVGLLSKKPIRVNGQEVVPAKLLKELLIRRPAEKGREVVQFILRVKVTGMKNGTRMERVVLVPFLPFKGEREDPETRATGEPGSIIVQTLARGGIKKKGVMGAECCIDPEEFMKEWSKRQGVEINETCRASMNM
jgi:saccharopine dehydrogenase-like NADP-dependent oxidoreductase